MKYLFLFLCLSLTACSSKPPAPVTFICVNPATAIQGVQIQSDDPNVVVGRNFLHIKMADGADVKLPRSLCMEIEKAQ